MKTKSTTDSHERRVLSSVGKSIVSPSRRLRATREDGLSAYDMIDRGLVSKQTDFSLPLTCGETSVLVTSKAKINEWSQQFRKQDVRTTGNGFAMTQLKLDMVSSTKRPTEASSRDETRKDSQDTKRAISENDHVHRTKHSHFARTIDEIREYSKLNDRHAAHQLVIRNGKLLRETPDFQSFRKRHRFEWGPIVDILHMLEKILASHAISIAYVDGQKVAKLAEDELRVPRRNDLIRCIDNAEDVEPLIVLPGRRYTGKDGDSAAAVLLQSVFRKYRQRRSFLSKRVQMKCAMKLVSVLRCASEQRRLASYLARRASNRATRWMAMQDNLRETWDEMHCKPHVVVHIPSMSIALSQRLSMRDFVREQNRQMIGRVCDMLEDNVDVIYVAPFDIGDDVRAYVYDLLKFRGIKHPQARVKIIVPENVDRFPSVTTLSALLRYSPRAMRMIRNFVAGRPAYIVPRYFGVEDRELALDLNIPVFASDSPETSRLSSSPSSVKRLFENARVVSAPGAHDVSDVSSLIKVLAKLIVAHPFTKRWLVRLNHEILRRGDAILDVDTSLPCVERVVRREFVDFDGGHTDYWLRPDIQERLQLLLREELQEQLPKHLQWHGAYSTWNEYARAIRQHGVSVEAIPNHVVGRPRADLIISPNGNIRVVATYDMIFGRSTCHIAAFSFPQRTVSHASLHGASKAIGSVLFERGVCGHVSVDFIVFALKDSSTKGGVWACDVTTGYTSTAAMFSSFRFLTNGRFDPLGGTYYVRKTSKATTTSQKTKWNTRSFVGLPCLSHPSLELVKSLDDFFRICRLHGVAFDPSACRGTSMLFSGSLAAGEIGVIAVSSDTHGALKRTLEVFALLKDHVAAGMPQKLDFSKSCTYTEAKLAVVDELKRVSERAHRSREKRHAGDTKEAIEENTGGENNTTEEGDSDDSTVGFEEIPGL